MSQLFHPSVGVGLLVVLFVPIGAPVPSSAQTIEVTEELDFDRPESWGMQFAAAVTSFSALEAPRAVAAGEIALGFEGASVPSLSTEERRIGFVGTKVEDIDRMPAYGRLRAAFGLGRGVTLEAGLVPPIELDGLEPTIVGLALAKSLHVTSSFAMGLRLGAQYGRLEGDITCSEDDVRAGDDLAGNPFGCDRPSEDELETTLVSLELVASLPPSRTGGFEPFLALAGHWLDGTFQVDARYRGVVDHTRLETEGAFWSAALGASGAVGESWRLGGSAYYAPLEIRRPGEGVTTEPVLNLRVAASRRLR